VGASNVPINGNLYDLHFDRRSDEAMRLTDWQRTLPITGGGEIQVSADCYDEGTHFQVTRIDSHGGMHSLDVDQNGKIDPKDDVPEIEARQTDFIPIANTAYRLFPNDIYKHDPKDPGPADATTSRAWSMANEFVYRTALRHQYQLPASAAGPENDGYVVAFQAMHGRGELKVFITRDFTAVKWVRERREELKE